MTDDYIPPPSDPPSDAEFWEALKHHPDDSAMLQAITSTLDEYGATGAVTLLARAPGIIGVSFKFPADPVFATAIAATLRKVAALFDEKVAAMQKKHEDPESEPAPHNRVTP